MKKFLEDKKRELKFKLAGPGHKLSEGSTAGPSSSNSGSASSSNSGSASLNAALQRCSKQAPEKNRRPNQQLEGGGEMRRPNQQLEGGGEMSLAKEKKEEVIASIVNNQRVFFTCDDFEGELFPLDTWKEKFRSHINVIKSTNPIKSSVMAIKSLNPNEDAEHCINILEKIVKNLVAYPNEEKYKLIRLGNMNIQKILKVEGAIDFLHIIGFEDQMITDKEQQNEESYLVHQIKEDVDLTFALNSLSSVKGFNLTLDRSFKVIMQKDESNGEEQPDEFYEWTISDIKKEHKYRMEEREKQSQLRTRKMKDENKPKVGVKYALIRIKITSDITIQGTFETNENLKDLRKFLDEKVEFTDKYILLSLPAKTYSESEEEKSFLELGLYPAVVLMIKFIGESKKEPKAILKQV